MLKVAIAARVKMFSVFSVQPELKLRTMDESANTAEHTSLCVMVIAARLAPLMNECATNKLFEAIAEVSLATTAAAESLREEFERRWSRPKPAALKHKEIWGQPTTAWRRWFAVKRSEARYAVKT